MHSLWSSLGWDTLRSAVWLGTRISPGVFGFRWQSVETFDTDSGKLVFMSRALRQASGGGVITWRLRHHHLLGECRRSPRHFVFTMCVWETVLRLDPPNKWPCVTLVRSRDTCVCKIDVKCNITSLAFYTHYSALYESEKNLISAKITHLTEH